MKTCLNTSRPFGGESIASTYKEVEQAGPITTGTDQSRGTPVIASPAYGVRRLTPRECERLQGFPDDWTRYTHDGKEIKDSPRYRMLGNAVTGDVAKWIFKRIARRDATQSDRGLAPS